MTIFDNFYNFDIFWQFWQFFTIFDNFWMFLDLRKVFRFLGSFQSFWKFLWPETWHLRHWLHFWQLRTTIWTITLWPLNREWWWQHSQFLRCFYESVPYENQGGQRLILAEEYNSIIYYFKLTQMAPNRLAECQSFNKEQNLQATFYSKKRA